jgi:putative transposase
MKESHMRRSRYSEAQIIKILKEAEAGVPIEDLCRQYGMSRSTYYKWKSKYGDMEVSQLKRLKELEEENRRLKRMYAELSLDHEILKDIIEKKL